jgi:hypothetical protein
MYDAVMCPLSEELIVSIRHLGICHSVQMNVWCAGLDEIQDRVTYTRCRFDTINSPDDGHMAARNM